MKAYEITTCTFWQLNSELRNILQSVRSVFPWRLLEADILVRNIQENDIFRVQIGGSAFIRAWAFIRAFMVYMPTTIPCEKNPAFLKL